MDSITHALYKAIAADDAHQRKTEEFTSAVRTINSGSFSGDCPGAGLQPIHTRRMVHQTYGDAAATDLHISLSRGPETLALYLEFVNAGLCPPTALVDIGADVILSPGEVQLFADLEDGQSQWCARLAKSSRYDSQKGVTINRVAWTEQTC
jgi:hypothetical protein